MTGVKPTIRVLLVDDAKEIRDTERMMLGFAADVEIVAEAENGLEAYERAGEYRPDIVLMDINMPVMDGIEATRRIADELPDVAVVIVSVQEEFESLKKAMQAGAREYLLKPFTSEAMLTAIRGVYARAEKRQRVTTTAVLSDRFRTKSRVVSLIGAKGGVGKTTLAVNLAVALARRGKRVAVVDLDLSFGDVGIFFGLNETQRTAYSLLLEGPEFAEALSRYMVSHESGAQVLLAPAQAEQAEYVTPAFAQGVLRALKKEFEYVIVDTGQALSEVFFTAVEMADETLLVSSADLPSVKNNRRLLDVLKTVGYATDNVKSVYVRRGVLSERSAQEVLGLEIYASVGFDPAAAGEAADLGVPLVAGQKRFRAARDMERLAAKMLSEERRSAHAATRTGMFRRAIWKARG